MNKPHKIYAAILARTLATWAFKNKKISAAQKGFLPFEGCLEGVLPHMEKMDGGYEFGNGTKVKILAYADICVIGQSKEEIERASRNSTL